MTERVKELIDQVKGLSPEQKIEFSDQFDLLFETDPDLEAVERLWIEESERCIDAAVRGDLSLVSSDEAVKELREELRKKRLSHP